VGHTGTLDPFASGLLIILLGSTTRLTEYLHDFPKTYQAVAHLGALSDTGDRTGHITPQDPIKPSLKDIEQAAQKFLGQIKQTPPAYSALKHQGQSLYTIARQEGTAAAANIAKQKTRTVTIHQLNIVNYQYPTLTLSVTCSTGTYIRSLVSDLAASLGTAAYTDQLERAAIGPWKLTQASTIENIAKMGLEGLTSQLITPAQIVSHMPSITLTDENVAKLKQGREVRGTFDGTPRNMPIAILDSSAQLIGIATQTQSTLLSPLKILP